MAAGYSLGGNFALRLALRARPLRVVRAAQLDPEDLVVHVGLVGAPDVIAERLVDQSDIATAIREPHVATVVSKVATNLEVRAELKRLQQEIIHAESVGDASSFSDGAGIVADSDPAAEEAETNDELVALFDANPEEESNVG